jgi:hypothetical protein
MIRDIMNDLELNIGIEQQSEVDMKSEFRELGHLTKLDILYDQARL